MTDDGKIKIAGVILSAGASERMGDFKPLLPIGNDTMIKRIIRMMRAAGTGRIYVVAGARFEELRAHLADEEVIILPNPDYAHTQMLDSLKIALREIGDRADAVVLMPVDVALPDADLYRKILMHAGALCVRPSCHQKAGHPVLIGAGLFQKILSDPGENGLKGILQSVRDETVWVETEDEGILMDADTKTDYEKMTENYQMRPHRIVVAGGLNVDIGGTSKETLVARDSNPGSVRISLGGVGRNIAHNLCLLGQKVSLLTAYGDDDYRDLIRQQAETIGLDLDRALCVSGEKTATYLFINEPDGELALAVNDMRICANLTPDYFAEHMDLINGSDLLIVDANLSAEAIRYLTDHAKVPVFADMVSSVKAASFLPCLSKLQAVKANALEAEVLSGVKITDEASLIAAGKRLEELGVRQVFISDGKNGMLAMENGIATKVGACAASPVNMTGAGDASLAALAVAYLQGKSAAGMAEYANAAASIAIESAETVSAMMCPAGVENRVRAMKSDR